MENLARKFLFCCCFILVTFACNLARAQEEEDQHGFSYDENSPRGPAHWGKLKPEWCTCSHGRMQSPIDLPDAKVQVDPSLGKLHRHYKPSNATLINRGHDIMLRWVDDAGYIRINGTLYQLKQCHWHSPTEHAINGKRYDLEAHLVHQSSDGKIAVIGILYKIGRPDPFLSMLEHYIEALADTLEEEEVVGFVDPNQIKFGSKGYYRYIGSLTTPACTEDVLWTIVDKVGTVSRHQVKLIRNAVHDGSKMNARPLQPINNRPILLYTLPVDED
ncbi:bifunctional monodehydroascorbate reductase and carbonic anhydrase nectarin-3-like [Coffea eugenioides]|uniref:carbonic anhydrase n=2 Tax=Coffea arabica TaxID=13443 RepID=A0A6P6TGK8_COFAR|nr:bifunctional monodehydroascorbate reductase and carbonic anhydrase nectarin-3-like [Coffea arabica]XP_027179231.1 bifunctional monodehydroascorbate reductase and carbonic anhydrase nectarin-3-like [Coffea eugenioides]